MMGKQRDNTLLASLAVFRQLYDNEKDVYDVISTFLMEIMRNNALFYISRSDITSKLNNTYKFNIPDAVVKVSLKRLVQQKIIKGDKQGNYSIIDTSKISKYSISEKQEKIQNNNDDIIKRLYQFIEKKQELSEVDKEKISDSFYCLLTDETNGGEYVEYISAFILENEANKELKNQLNLIREGVILHTGITYNHSLKECGNWVTDLTIYMDMEILFHIAGYNDSLYQKLVEDFLSFVEEINITAQNERIKLKYFKKVEEKIDGYFKTAEDIVKGKITPNPSSPAMVSIVNGCKEPSDVSGKKSDFNLLLKNNRIELDTYQNYFSEHNHEYNAVSDETLQVMSNDIGKDVQPHSTFLNYISIRRQERKHSNFEHIGHILLTGNKTTLNVAQHNSMKEEGNVPLATDLLFLTNRFWFRLNKGFGSNSPTSFDIITKVQIGLSSMLTKKVKEGFEILTTQVQNKELNKEQVKGKIVYLRSVVRTPDKITKENVESVLSTITEEGLNMVYEGQSYLKTQVKEKDEQILKMKQQILDGKISEKERLESRRCKLDKKALSKYNPFKFLVSGVAIVCLVLDYLLNSLIMVKIIPIIYKINSGKKLNLSKNIREYIRGKEEKFKLQIYKKNNFKIDSLKKVESEINNLREEIKKLKVANDR